MAQPLGVEHHASRGFLMQLEPMLPRIGLRYAKRRKRSLRRNEVIADFQFVGAD